MRLSDAPRPSSCPAVLAELCMLLAGGASSTSATDTAVCICRGAGAWLGKASTRMRISRDLRTPALQPGGGARGEHIYHQN